MKIDRSIVAPAPRSRVWRALTDIREFAQWFSVECTAGQFAPGERVDMVCTTPGYEGVKFYVIVDEMTPERRFAWRWHPGVEKPGEDFSSEAMTQVVFELEDEASGALIRVVESGFDLLPPERREKAHKENDGGWEFMLSALVQYL